MTNEPNPRADATRAELAAMVQDLRGKLARAEGERDALKAALDEIDHHEVGAYEVAWSDSPEPCEACVEMREIAERGLSNARAARKAPTP